MNRLTAAFAIALCALGLSGTAAQAQTTSLQFRAPLNYRFPVLPRSHTFSYNRTRHPGWHRHRHHRRAFLPAFAGPAVIYQNGEIGIPPEHDVDTLPAPAAQPVVYRIGETGGCGLQRLQVPGSHGRTTVNVWRC
jgi:hypothetical protein